LLRSQKRVELHGIVYDGYLPCLRVLKGTEERGLRRIG
jgi:arginine decarboxylase